MAPSVDPSVASACDDQTSDLNQLLIHPTFIPRRFTMFQTFRSSHLFIRLTAGVVLVSLLAAGIGLSRMIPALAGASTYYIHCATRNVANNATSPSTPS